MALELDRPSRLPLVREGPPPPLPRAGPGSGTGPSVAGASRVRLLVSACLLGDRVRYDGGHKLDHFLADQLGHFVEWVRVCPEVEAGLPTPRPSMRLEGDPRAPRLVSRTGADLTEPMRRFAERRLDELEADTLCGYVCKKDSPSSGMTRVRVYAENGVPTHDGAGLFTAAFQARFPAVPVEEEGRLHDARLRESFVERIFCRRRLLDLRAGARTAARLAEFHAAHELLLLAHGEAGHAALSQLVAGAGPHPSAELLAAYERGFLAAVARPAVRDDVVAVLLRSLGALRARLGRDEAAELCETIDAYCRALVPLVVPLTLVRHHVRRHRVAALARQVYLAPYPAELGLRNAI